MNISDPRLADLSILTLAALRARRRRQVLNWRSTQGISALLEAGKALPQRSPWTLPDLDTSSGMGQLLAEARQWRKESSDGA